MIGKPFHVAGAGCVLTRRGGRLVAFHDGELRASAPLALVGEVVLTGRVTVTTAALHALLAHDIPLVLLSGIGRPLGRLEPPTAPHVLARTRQLDLHRDPEVRLILAREMITAKICDQGVLLRRRARRSLDPEQVWQAVSRLSVLEQAAGSAASVPELLGVEGAAAGAYFGAIRTLVIPGHDFTARRREGRDLVNVLINYCSALLRETVMSAVLAAGLDPYLSFLHTPARGRPTLTFDLMEEWRAVLLEPTVLALLGLKSVTTDDLADDGGRPCLTPAATGAAVMRFQHRLAAPARSWPVFSGSPSYGELTSRQALALRTALLGDPGSYRAFRWR